MHVNGFPNSHLKHSQEGVPHVVDNLADSVLSVGHEGSLRPVQNVEGDVPEAKEAKRNPEVDTKSVEHPAEVRQTFGCLKVVWEEEVVSQGDDEPHQVRAVQLGSDNLKHLNPLFTVTID